MRIAFFFFLTMIPVALFFFSHNLTHLKGQVRDKGLPIALVKRRGRQEGGLGAARTPRVDDLASPTYFT